MYNRLHARNARLGPRQYIVLLTTELLSYQEGKEKKALQGKSLQHKET